jgi:amino acid transporter
MTLPLDGADTVAQSAPTPGEAIQPLSGEELEALRQVGRHWNELLADRLERLRALPVDPSLRFAEGVRPGRFGRFARVSLFRPEGPDAVEATEAATEPVSPPAQLFEAFQRLVIGPPLRSSAVLQERMRKLIALPVLSSDLFASVAYGPEAMLSVLALAGSDALDLSLPLTGALVVLMVAIGVSYRQTIAAYPTGAGAYIVAGHNLGERAGVTAAVALMADYVLTVAVSVATGVASITSALPGLTPYSIELGLATIAVLLAGNLRGVRESGYLFAAPTYLFLGAMLLLLVVGFVDAAGRDFAAVPPPPLEPVEGLTVLLVLRAFSSGATSMTGIEAISNALPAFQPPEWRNARATLGWMVVLMVVLFVGIMLLLRLDGVAPRSDETLLSQLAHLHLGGGVLYGFVQGATAVLLLFGANTAYNGLPRLLYFMARSHHAPRAFLRMGDRLAFSNGIVALTVAATAVYLGFNGKLLALIPLFAIGVFLAVTLSEAGMVVYWWRTRGEHWRKSLLVNALGGVLSAVVLLVAAVTKFTEGAWVVVVGVPLLVWVCLRVKRHYDGVGESIALLPPTSPVGRSARAEAEASPEQVQHLMIVTVERLDLANLRALAYVASLEQPLLAVHLSPDEEEAERFRHEWETFAVPLRFEIVVSPYRALVAPLAHYVEALHVQRPDLTTTVVLPELVVRHAWQQLLHSQVGPRLRLALRLQPGIVVTTVPFHLRG